MIAFEDQRRKVDALNRRLHEANAAIAIVKERAAAGNRAALTADVGRLKASPMNYTGHTRGNTLENNKDSLASERGCLPIS